MIDSDIIDMLGALRNTTVARLSPESALESDTALARRTAILRSIRNTVLPRRLEFVVASGARLVFEVNSARVTDIVDAFGEELPNFETDGRETVTQVIAQFILDFSAQPGPLELLSLHPDASPEADDVGITYNEIEKACTALSRPDAKVASATQETPTSPDTEEVSDIPVEETSGTSLCQEFFEGSAGFALGRLHIDAKDGAVRAAGEACEAGISFCPDAKILNQFAQDLSVWNDDCGAAVQKPQMILLRSKNKQAPSLAVVRDENTTAAVAVYEARKLGGAVSLWKALTEKYLN